MRGLPIAFVLTGVEDGTNEGPLSAPRSTMISKFALTSAACLVILSGAKMASAQSSIGYTKDDCSASRDVKFANVIVKANQSVDVDLSKEVTELVWYCGGSKERVANDQPFDRVKLTRAVNGALTWKFYDRKDKAQPAPSEPDRDNSDDRDDDNEGEKTKPTKKPTMSTGPHLLQVLAVPCKRSYFTVTSGERVSGPELLKSHEQVAVYEKLESPEVRWICTNQEKYKQQGEKEKTLQCPEGTDVIRVQRGASVGYNPGEVVIQCKSTTRSADGAVKLNAKAEHDGPSWTMTVNETCKRGEVVVDIGTKVSGPPSLTPTNKLGGTGTLVYKVTSNTIHWSCSPGVRAEKTTKCPSGTTLVKVQRGAPHNVTFMCYK